MLEPGNVIEFDRKKYFKYVRQLGKGGTGTTYLFKDETTDMFFAIKKYTPIDIAHIDEDYIRFVDEIKILFRLSHPNIVRIYNYYLYPVSKVGYIQMEYIDGVPINQFQATLWGIDWGDIFTELISAFEYLEANKILHRDVRPANILIDNNFNIKIIDFGFGKKIDTDEQSINSIVLNWPVSQKPEEISKTIYTHQTEIFFVGKLFENLLGDELNQFRYRFILEKMTEIKPDQRYLSFHEVSEAISTGMLMDASFSESEKEVYIAFADQLLYHTGLRQS